MSSTRRSAGLLLYRRPSRDAVEVLLGHPGGPLFERRDADTWSVLKGEYEPDETPWEVACREFQEETGHPPPDGQPIELGEIRQKGGKVVVAWALEGDLDPATAHSNTFAFQWPPRSGRYVDVPEIDRVAWFTPNEARLRIKATQVPFIDRLLEALGA